jgi:hypothetical protein
MGKGDHKINGKGDCFVANYHYLDRIKTKGYWLCHGIVTNAIDKLPMVHCWIEYELPVDVPGEYQESVVMQGVIDVSQGRNIDIPKGLYYWAGEIDPENVRRYTVREAAKKALQHNHYGPWDIEFER